jgi:hypothetical protein
MWDRGQHATLTFSYLSKTACSAVAFYPTVRGCTKRTRLRASPLTRPTRPPAGFFHSDGVNRSSRAPGSSISPGSGPSSIRRAQAIPSHPRPSGARSGTPDETNWREKAGKIRARFRGSCGPDLSARLGGRRPHRLVFRASSFLHSSSSARCKGCRRWPASHAARRVNASAAI